MMTTDYLALATKVYQNYTGLMRGHPKGLGGSMLLVDSPRGASAAAECMVRAANISGAATLFIEPDVVSARQCVRSGMCDFLITNLDEALRILKNELRRKQPAAVCLLAEPASVLDECVQRGVQPEMCALGQGTALSQPVRTLMSRGAVLFTDLEHGKCATDADLGWASWSALAQSARVLPLLDRLALAALGPEMQAERQRWVLGSPQYLSLGGRSNGSVAGHGPGVIHTVLMREAETASFAQSVWLAIAAGHLPESLTLRYGTKLLATAAVAADEWFSR